MRRLILLGNAVFEHELAGFCLSLALGYPIDGLRLIRVRIGTWQFASASLLHAIRWILLIGLIAFADGKMVTMKVPYPTGFFAKGLDGRIDDPNGGWKGRGLWTSSGDRTPWHQEGGKGHTPMIVHIQLRPDPLAD